MIQDTSTLILSENQYNILRQVILDPKTTFPMSFFDTSDGYFLFHTGIIRRNQTSVTREYFTIHIFPDGLHAINRYEENQKHLQQNEKHWEKSLEVANKANEISDIRAKEANKIAKRANWIAFFAILASIGSILISIFLKAKP